MLKHSHPLLVVAWPLWLAESISEQDFGADDLEAKSTSFVGQNLHETIQTLGISSSHTVFEVGKNGISVLLNRHGKGPEHLSNIGGDLIEPDKIALEGFLFGRGFIDAVKRFLESVGSFQPGEVLEPGFKNQRFMFVQGVGAFQQQKSVVHQGSSLSICQTGSYLLANGFKALVKQFQDVPFVCNQMDMWQNQMNGVMVSCPQIGTDDGDLFFRAVRQTLQIVDNRLLTAVTNQLNNLMMLNISDDTSVLVQQVQFINTQVAYFCRRVSGLDISSKFTEQDANQLLINSYLISDVGESAAQCGLLNVMCQAFGHEMVFIHVWDWLKEGAAASTTPIPFAMNDDANVLPSHRLIQVGLRLYLMPVQFGMAAMGTTRWRSDQLRLDVKVVFILVNRKDVVVGQSQDVQKALSPKKELPHKFFGCSEIPVAGEIRLLRALVIWVKRERILMIEHLLPGKTGRRGSTVSIVHLSYDLRDELDAIVSRYNEEYGPGGVPSAELAVVLLRALGGSERVAVEKLRDLCQYWLDTGKWPDEG